MVAVYLAFGLAVERGARPDGKLREFARLLCSPVTRPVARLLAPGASERRVLAVGLAGAAALWAAVVLLDRSLRGG